METTPLPPNPIENVAFSIFSVTFPCRFVKVEVWLIAAAMKEDYSRNELEAAEVASPSISLGNVASSCGRDLKDFVSKLHNSEWKT